jgi:ribosomal protein S18 acetylase RimI-like enzyme
MEGTMNLRIQKGISGVSFKDVADLIEAVHWGVRDPGQLERSFKKSETVFVFDDAVLVGMGRCITDGEYYATFWDIIVKPGYQGKGIGRKIVEKLMEGLQDMQFIALTSTPGNETFYKKFGFRLQKTAMVILNIPEYPEEEMAKLIE